MKATYACANGVQGEAKIDHMGKQGRLRGDVAMFAVNAARVRVDVQNSFAGNVMTLTSDGRHFKLNDVSQRQFLVGPSKPCNLARLTQVSMPGHALVYLLRGEAPLLVHKPAETTIRWQDGAFSVTVPSRHQASQSLRLSVYPDDYQKPWQQQRVRVLRVVTRQRGTVLFDAEMDKHRPARTAPAREDEEGIEDPILPSGGVCNVDIPRRIRMRVPASGDDVVFSYQKVHFNPPIPERAFDQPFPTGARQRFVDCSAP